MTDILDEAARAARESGSPVASVIGSAVGGAATGVAVGSAVAVGIPIAGFAAGAVASAAGATAATSLGIMASGMAIGSAIPIPVLGTVIGAIVGAIGAVVSFFNNRPSREFARALLATFRQYPNVLREWVNERETFGVPHDHSALRSRWGYVEMLREVAGESGPDPFEDPAWRKRFEAGRVDPAPPAEDLDLAALGLGATRAEAVDAAAKVEPLFRPIRDVFDARFETTRLHGTTAIHMVVRPRILAPEGLSGTSREVAERPKLFVYGDRIPMIQTTETQAVIVPFPPSAAVLRRAELLRGRLSTLPEVREVRVAPLRAVPLPDDAAYGFEVVVDPSTTVAKIHEIEILSGVIFAGEPAAARVVIVTRAEQSSAGAVVGVGLVLAVLGGAALVALSRARPGPPAFGSNPYIRG